MSAVDRLLRWLAKLIVRGPHARSVLDDLDEALQRDLARGSSSPCARVRYAGNALASALSLGRERARRAPRRLPPLGISLLDVKLGMRMLIRYPGLTALGGLAIAFAIFAGAGTFEFLRQVAFPTLPFEGGDRLVTVQLWKVGEGRPRPALFDYGIWREELTTVEELGAHTSFVRNLIVDGSGAHSVTGAEMDAAGFRITGVEPVLGRTLVEADEGPGAPLVVVLGYEVWRTVLAGDPGVVGRVVRMGSEPATVVGVMPEGFAFPVAHDVWLPLRLDPRAVEPGGGPPISVFGRLGPGVSLADARREADRIGQRLAASLPTTHEHVRTVVRRYGVFPPVPVSFSDGLASVLVMSWNLPLLLFLILVCGNVALLMFARAATRESELVVRSALGAGRRHIVAQLFAEALVLAALGAAVGLSVARYGLRWGYHIVQIELLEGPLPFWLRPELSLRTVAYTLLLTLVGAVVAGVLPALKATRGLGAQLRRASAGAGGLRVGGIWTVVIVVQIAVTIAFPAVTFAVGSEGRDIRIFDLGIPAHEYLTAQIVVPPAESDSAGGEDPAAAFRTRSRTTLAELEAKLLADPRVAGVTFAERAPRTYNGWNQVEVDGPTAPPQDERGHRLGRVNVQADFFETLGIAPRAGRGFHPADAEAGSRAVIVNEAFVAYVLGGRNAVGVSLRYVASERNRSPDQEPGPWLEIVGVVQDLGAMSGYSSAVVYHPVPDGSMNPGYALLHVRDDAGGFAPRLRSMAFDVDPTLRIEETVTLDRIVDDTVEFYRFWVYTLMMVSAVGVVLSLGGIYAVMSFAVARRTREIGVRVALGAPKPRIVLSVFRRPLFQVTMGLLAGALLSSFLLGLSDTDTSSRELAWFAGYLALMTAVCMSACVTPIRRALAVEPSEALRAE